MTAEAIAPSWVFLVLVSPPLLSLSFLLHASQGNSEEQTCSQECGVFDDVCLFLGFKSSCTLKFSISHQPTALVSEEEYCSSVGLMKGDPVLFLPTKVGWPLKPVQARPGRHHTVDVTTL